MCKSKYKSVVCNKVSVPPQSYGTSLLYIFPAMHGLCEWRCSWMSEGLVNLFNMENISWGRYLYLTALFSLCHIWQQTTPCRLCSPCPFFHFFFCCSFLLPFISTIVHHHWPSELAPLSHLIISNSKRRSSTLFTRLQFFTFPPVSFPSVSSILTPSDAHVPIRHKALTQSVSNSEASRVADSVLSRSGGGRWLKDIW